MFIELEPVFNNIGLSLDFDYQLDLSECEFAGSRPFTTPVRVKGRVRNSTGIVELSAEAVFTLSTRCDRCAVELERKFAVPVEHTLVTHLNHEDNDELILIDNFRFDLDPLVREDIFLSLPAKLLCREDCKGICPRCGRNLNEGPCSCEKPVDPRLAVLKQLLDN